MMTQFIKVYTKHLGGGGLINARATQAKVITEN